VTGDPDAAAAAFRKELSSNVADYAANLGLGQILTRRQQYRDALPFLQRALAERPDSAGANIAAGECFSGLGDVATARKYLEAAVKVAPGSLDAHRILLAVYRQLNLTALTNREQARVAELGALARASEPGPKLNEMAPDFTLADALTGKAVHLADLRVKSGAVLVFGSYSCPNFRSSAEDLKRLHGMYGDRIPFLLVYIREAHATTDWQSTRNQREGIEIAPATDMRDKQQHAAMCSRNLHLSFPAVVDGMDGAVESAYAAWPSRLFVIDKAGQVRYETRLTELDFHPRELQHVLAQLNTSTKDSNE
jgi:tetratricopeptide (TPR) repeat protein